MNNHLTRILFIISCFVVLGLWGIYYLVSPPSVEAFVARVAVIDSVRIKTQSVPFIKVRQLLEEQHAKAHQEILEQERSIRQQDEELRKGTISNQEKHKKKQALDKKVTELQQSVQKKQDKLTKQFALLTERLETELNEIIAKIVKELGFNLVLNTTIQETKAILYADPALDITNEIIKRLDKKMPTVTLPSLES